MKYVAALFAIAVLAGCSKPAEPPPLIVPRTGTIIGYPVPPNVDEETLSYAVLGALKGKLDDDLDSNAAERIEKADLLRRVKSQRYKIDCIRAWALKLPNKQVAAMYLSWLEWYSHHTDDAEKSALKPPRKTDADERYERTQRAITNSRFMEIPKPKDCAPTEIVKP